ncbi:UNVERIFIED_CONTAM: hypothetical protein PYX00_006704 [Menopon gallinae]|uniref:Large ribosomal subunit protein uL11m n=1 Tax=Menopon gallinae TaxID=328185 RepID=A0AAW2HXW9_9NEOP
MSKAKTVLKTYKVYSAETRPLTNRFTQTIRAGLAAAGPPLGPLLGKYGINVAAFCKDFNEKTSNYIKGIPLPCIVTIKPDRSYNIDIRKPGMPYYLLKAAGVTTPQIYKGQSGQITIKHIYEIAKILHEDPYSYYQIHELHDVCKQVARKAYKLGIKVVKEIDPVSYGEYLKNKKMYLDKKEAEQVARMEAKLLRK